VFGCGCDRTSSAGPEAGVAAELRQGEAFRRLAEMAGALGDGLGLDLREAISSDGHPLLRDGRPPGAGRRRTSLAFCSVAQPTRG